VEFLTRCLLPSNAPIVRVKAPLPTKLHSRLCHDKDTHVSDETEAMEDADPPEDRPAITDIPGMTEEIRRFHASANLGYSVVDGPFDKTYCTISLPVDEDAGKAIKIAVDRYEYNSFCCLGGECFDHVVILCVCETLLGFRVPLTQSLASLFCKV